MKADWIFSEISTLLFILYFLFVAVFLFIKFTKIKYYKPQPIEWFYLTGGLFFSQWYFWWMDDAFIYFRYIDNLLFLKIGLVYNNGEYVDGLSSPGWPLFLTIFRATGLSYWVIIRLISIVSFVLFWFMLVQFNGKLSPKTTVINFPLAYLTFNYAVVSFFSVGMETPLVQVFAVAYALYILNPAPIILQVLLAVSPMFRQELVLPFIFCALWTWLYHKKIPLKMISIAIIIMGSWVLFRIYYYADLFPNTFYLKNVVDIKQGLTFVHQTVGTYHFYVVVAVFLLLIIYALKKKNVQLEIPKRLMMVLTALPVTLYIIKIGGDQLHYKYLAFPFILTVCSFSGIIEHFIEVFHLNRYKVLKPAVGVTVSLIVFLFYPPQLDSHPFSLKAKAKRVDGIYDAQDHRRQKEYTTYLQWGEKINIEMMKNYRNKYRPFKYEDTERAFGCMFSYLHFNKRVIHGLGLTDAILAHTEMKIDSPAHKEGLKPLGDDLIFIYKTSDNIGRGIYRKAVEDGRAPEWIRNNLEAIEIIERKIYNNHNFWENLRLAFTSTPKIKP